MLPRSWTERIRDILDAMSEIETFTHGMAFDAFRNDAKTIRAVELDFIIIGEAANRIPETVQAAYPEIPWHLMRAMRNRLVHVYFSVDPQVVWDTIHNDLPPLIPLLESLLRDTGP
jgi:uncharacterized protein with HEPN domain